MNKTNVRFAVAAATAAVLVPTATACRDSGTAAASRTSPAVTPRPTADDLANKPAETILAEARKGLAGARYVHVKGSLIDKRQRIALNLRLAPHSTAGTITAPVKGHSVPMKIRMLHGKVYISSRQLIRLVGGAAAVNLIGDRWIVSSAKDMGDASGLLSPANLAGMVKLDAADTLVKGKPTTIGGIPVIGLQAKDGVLYVATTGTPRPVRLVSAPHTPRQRIDFTDYDVPFTVTAPPHPIDGNSGKSA